MKFDKTTFALTLDTKECFCRDGKVAGPITCVKCHGTGQGPKGGRNGCKMCNGTGTMYSMEFNPLVCGACHGTMTVAETWYDRIPKEAVAALADRIVVKRVERRNDWIENHLGLGALWTAQDYGQAWERTDAQVVADIRDSLLNGHGGFIQAVNVIDRAGTCEHTKSCIMADQIVVEVRKDGYSVKAKITSVA
jgi:hypothetical protein